MYICTCCGNLFEEPHTLLYDYGYMGSAPVMERESVCPKCFEAAYEEAEECENCGKYMTKKQHRNGNGFCRECGIAINIRFNALIRESFSEREIEYLNAVYDGECFCAEE